MRKSCLFFCFILLFFSFFAYGQCDEKGSIVISEIYFDTRYGENISTKYHHFGEFIELFNSSDQPIDLTGWVLKDNHTEFVIGGFSAPQQHANTIIQPGGIKIITYSGWNTYRQSWYNGTTNFGSGSEIGGINKFIELFPQAQGHEQDIILQNRIVLYNDADKVSLYNPYGRLIHEISYRNGAKRTVSAVSEFMDIQGVDIDLQGANKIDNQNGGIFNGAIVEPYKKSLYLTDESAYYFNEDFVIEVGQATPFSIPYTIELLKPHQDLFLPPSENFNWIQSTVYEIGGGNFLKQKKLSEGRVYYDDLAKPTVSISRDFVNSVSWASETIYDDFGRPYRTSFPSVVCYNDLRKVEVLSNSTAKNMFLDYYYGDENDYNEFQATAAYPYTEVEYDKLNPGNVIRSYGGNKIDDEWKTGYSFTVPATQEMYYVFGHNYYLGNLESGNQKEVITKFYKTISIDPHGVESVVFTDGEGKVLAAARSADATYSYPVISTIGTQGYIDIYIPSGTPSGTFLTSSSHYKVYNLKTGLQISPTPSTLASGNAYRIEAVTTPAEDYKTYIHTSTGVISAQSGALGVSYKVNYYDYALNYYDKTDRLIKTIQPNGFNLNCINANKVLANPIHSFETTYEYNTLGQLIKTVSPDEGEAKFAYRKDGQIRYSQSATQMAEGKISYTEYDQYARPIESGVIKLGLYVTWGMAVSLVDSYLPTGTKSEQTYTIYDYETNYTGTPPPTLASVLSANGLDPFSFIPKNLSGNVVTSYNENSQTWYSYDIYGRVEWVVQNVEGIGAKTIHYEYDGRGQVRKVLYQKNNLLERFVHRYSYDLNGNITSIETSINNVTFEKHADYEYYIDGSLKRTELAGGIQGLDYVYTLGGMLKSINHPSLSAADDPGGDSNDVFGITLDYYSGDYIRPSKPQFTTANNVTGVNNNYYDGNIKAIRWANISLDDVTGNIIPKAYAYGYNNNKWLTNAQFGSTVLPKVITPEPRYKEGGLQYDANGNITSLQRSNGLGTITDNLTYNYYQGTNRLSHVTDGSSSNTAGEITSQNLNNYEYNLKGQLTKNVKEGLEYFYNTQGLVTEVKKNAQSLVKFYYNERGQRIKKESFVGLTSTDYYVLDASGNTMAVYNKVETNPVVLKEQPVYGSGRLGVFYKADNSTAYEIKDHLGNVRAVIKKINDQAPVQQYADYYPFGEQLPGRNSMSNYRYAFQGQELDSETGMEAFQLRLWDGRLGRWLAPDPYGQYHSPYLGMGNNPISRIDPDGGWDDWIKNLETGKYEYDPTVTGEHNTPTGFKYIGPEDNDIIIDLFGTNSFTTKPVTDFGMIDYQDFENRYSASGGAPLSFTGKTKMSIFLIAMVTNTDMGRTFDGVEARVSVTGTYVAPYPNMNIKLFGRSMSVNGSEMSPLEFTTPTIYQGGGPNSVPTLTYSQKWSANSIQANYGRIVDLKFQFYGQYANGLNSLRYPGIFGLLGFENNTKFSTTIRFHSLGINNYKP